MRMSKRTEFKNRDRFIQLGIAIAALRKMRGMSQEQLAEKANVSRSHISAIEAPGLVRPFSLEVLFNIADAYYRYGDSGKALAYAEKLPNAYKSRENALVRILTDDRQRSAVAKEALPRLMWSLALHLQTLAETEQNPTYSEKISQIRSILFDGIASENPQ